MDVFVPGPAGRLEARLWKPVGVESPKVAVAVCHPHPLYGGTMNSTVVFRIARGMQQAGAAVLRFNFRGVGRSAGSHDGAGGETLDLQASLDWLAREFPESELWAAGFSFGSRTVVARAAVEPRIARIVLVALPVLAFDCSALRSVRQPGLILMAEHDEYGTMSELRRQFPALQPELELHEIGGAGHFFEGATAELQTRVREYTHRTVTRSA